MFDVISYEKGSSAILLESTKTDFLQKCRVIWKEALGKNWNTGNSS